MSEFKERYVEPIFKRDELVAITNQPTWSSLEPNYPSPDALLPKRLTVPDIYSVIEALGKDSPLTKIEDSSNPNKPHLDLGNGMNLSFYDWGDSRWCYLLSLDRFKMAVVVGGYYPQLLIPDDPKICLVNPGLGKDSMLYSDLRTYFFVPTEQTTKQTTDRRISGSSIAFQEWGGENKLSMAHDPRILIASARVRAYIKSHGFRVTQDTNVELTHPRHHLLNQGILRMPAVIDIPCERIRGK